MGTIWESTPSTNFAISANAQIAEPNDGFFPEFSRVSVKLGEWILSFTSFSCFVDRWRLLPPTGQLNPFFLIQSTSARTLMWRAFRMLLMWVTTCMFPVLREPRNFL